MNHRSPFDKVQQFLTYEYKITYILQIECAERIWASYFNFDVPDYRTTGTDMTWECVPGYPGTVLAENRY